MACVNVTVAFVQFFSFTQTVRGCKINWPVKRPFFLVHFSSPKGDRLKANVTVQIQFLSTGAPHFLFSKGKLDTNDTNKTYYSKGFN